MERYSLFTTSVEPWTCGFTHQPPKILGVFLTVLEVEGVRLPDVALKTWVKRSKECTGNSRIRRFEEHQIQGVLEVWGSFVLDRSWRIRALIWRNSYKHCNQLFIHSGWPWWRRTSSSRVEVALNEDEQGWTTINIGVFSLSLSLSLSIYFNIALDYLNNWLVNC